MFTELLDLKSGNVDTIKGTSLISKGLIEMQYSLFEETCSENEDLGAGEGKVCIKCNTYLPLSSFTFSSGANYLRPECKPSNNEMTKVRNKLRQDHCHDTDTFRGWLCHKCNRALGGMDDNVPTLERAIQYVENHLKRTFLV